MNKTKSQTLLHQAWHFIVHLRWHYQVFILPGGYLLGGVLSENIDWPLFTTQFLNVHLLLFGGATAYNSYWDKDQGPVGGLRHPPPVHRWMRGASILLQLFGLLLTMQIGLLFSVLYMTSMLFFWLYSTPHFRWKGTPLRSLMAIGISTGSNSVLMGYIAAGNSGLSLQIIMAAVGVMLIILSLYPVSQIYQIDEDIERGDQTFVMHFGFAGVLQFFAIAFAGGMVLVAFSIMQAKIWTGTVFMVIGAVTGLWVYGQLKRLKAERGDYQSVMRIKYLTSLAFVTFIVLLLVLQQIGIEI